MANLQIRNVPSGLHERLRRYAREDNRSMSDIVLAAIRRELDMREWQKRLAQDPPTDLGVPAAVLLHEERSLYEAETE